MSGDISAIDYTNRLGERSVRKITPIRIYFGLNSFHINEGPQWFLVAYDHYKKDLRHFAMKDIHSFKATP